MRAASRSRGRARRAANLGFSGGAFTRLLVMAGVNRRIASTCNANMNIEIGQLWEAASVLLALQAASLGWRINRESSASEKGEPTWLPVADIINLLAMAVSVSCVFLAPVLGLWSANGAVRSFGIVLILTVGHAISLAAHYELFNIGKRSHAYFPLQERVAVGATLAAVAAYLLALAL